MKLYKRSFRVRCEKEKIIVRDPDMYKDQDRDKDRYNERNREKVLPCEHRGNSV